MDRIDLTGRWALSHTGGPTPNHVDPVQADIPGENITALRLAGLIVDPYVGENELEVQWVGRCDWAFERSVSVDYRFASLPCHLLSFDSIDTIASVVVNGTKVGDSSNMFARARLEIPRGVLTPGENTIRVEIASPERAALAAAKKLPYPIPYSENPVQSPHRNLIRKTQCHSGWDWGPCLMSSGIYGRAELLGSAEPILEYADCDAKRTAGSGWLLVVTPTLRNTLGEQRAGRLAVEVRSSDGTTVASGERDVIVGSGVQSASSVSLSIDDPALWWPAGEGAQPLYTVNITAFGDSISKRIGFRSLEVRRNGDEFGMSFAVTVNGRPIFAKGANWIPLDALPSRGTDDHLRDLLTSAVDANMNMIRVWGGGTYESDRFYDLCDELGILIWQDFMFACAMYPADHAFLESVRGEVAHQVLRLKDHPCLALWCGNNENIGALNWYEVTKQNRDRYLVNYDRLNNGVVGQTARALDPDRLFWPSSPTDGLDDYSDDWVADKQGDMHYWSVWHGGLPFAAYRAVVPRFCSEFGFQSFPSASTVNQYARKAHHNVTAPDMEHHQRNPRGNTIIMQTMSRYFRFPSGFENQLYLSQVQQAWAIQTAVEYWRSQRPRCMGAIYWQLNDTWPVASWSSLEYGGKWKLLHYAARRFFDPHLVAAIPVDSKGIAIADESVPTSAIQVYVINDSQDPLTATLSLKTFGFDGRTVGTPGESQVTVPACTSKRCATLSLDQMPFPVEAAFGVAELLLPSGVRRSTQFFLTAPKRCELMDPELEITVSPTEEGAAVTARSSAPAFYVALDAGDLPGRFSDNNLYLHPGVPVTVAFLSSGDLGATAAPMPVSVRSLFDTYH